MELSQKTQFYIGRIKNLLQSYLLGVVLLCFGFLCWLNYDELLCVLGFTVIFVAILIFADDVKNIFAMVFSVPFIINDIGQDANWTLYIGAISLAIVTMICFLIRTFVLDGKKTVKGKMFYGFLFALLVFTLAGISRPNYLSVIITLGLFSATFFLYFIVLNKTVDFNKYFPFMLVLLATVLLAETLITNLSHYGLISFNNPEFYCAENKNTIAIYLLLGIIGAFALLINTKYNWCFMLVAIPFYIGILSTCCRVVIFVALLTYFALMVVGLIITERKIVYGAFFCAIIVFAIVYAIIKKNDIMELINVLASKGGGVSGRDELWKWCFSKFEKYPFFGYGFVADETIPSIRNNLPVVLAHNTVLQWLTSLGIIGSTFICGFYYNKYYLLFSGFNKKRVSVLVAILCVALIGMLDQAPTMDFFTFLFPIIAIASIERQNKKIKLLK